MHQPRNASIASIGRLLRLEPQGRFALLKLAGAPKRVTSPFEVTFDVGDGQTPERRGSAVLRVSKTLIPMPGIEPGPYG